MSNYTKLDVLVLSGGKATRLEQHRKIITADHFPMLPQYWNQEGPKGLTMLSINHTPKPLLDLHLEQYWQTPLINRISLGLGFASQMIIDYYRTSQPDRSLYFTTEQHPAGTIAPLLKLHQANQLSDSPLLLANGDNLLHLDFPQILSTIQHISNQSGDIPFILNILTLVPWEKSASYGVANYVPEDSIIKGFYEKQNIESNPYILLNNKRYSYINSGFSILIKPKQFIEQYVDPTLFDLVDALDSGAKPYKVYEKLVKYETLYEKLAQKNILFGYHQPGYWADSGSEEQILSIEAEYQQMG